MGIFSAIFGSSSSSTSSTETGDLSARGVEYQNIFDQMFADMLMENGYNVDTEERVVYSDPNKAASYQKRIEEIDLQIQETQAKLDKGPNQNQQQYLTQQLNSLQQQKVRYERQLTDLDQETITDFNLTKKEDPRIEDAIKKYGEDSKEVTAIREQVSQEEVFKAESMAEISQNYLQSLNKYMSGDMSYTPEQAEMVDQYIAPVKDILMQTSNDLLSTFKDNLNEMNSSLDQIGYQIDQTGYEIESALQAAYVQAEQSGDRLVDILSEVNASSEAKAKFEFDLMSEDIEKQVNAQAALLGLPPNSEAAQYQKAKLKSDALTSIQLNLAEDLQKATLDIRSDEEATKKQISFAKATLAADIGGQKVDLAKAKSQLLGDYLGKAENIVAGRGDALIALEQQKQGELKNLAYGNLPALFQAGGQALGFDESLQSSDISQYASLMSPASSQLGVEQQRTFAESTTKNTQTSTPSPFSAFTDVLSTALGGYGAGVDLGLWGKSSGSS